MRDEDYFSGILRFNTTFICLNIILVLIFFLSWYRSYKKTGWAIDPWHFFLLMAYFFPFLLMYPFAGSNINFLFVGGHISEIQRNINEAYMVSLTGYIFLFIGGFLFNQFKKRNFINYLFILPFKTTLGYLFKTVVLNKLVCTILLYLYILSLIIVLFIAYKGGSFNDPRAYFYYNDKLRVIYNTTNSLSAIVSLVLMARIFQFNALSDKIYFGLFVVFTFFIGARAAALTPLLTVFIYVVYFNWKGKIKLQRTFLFGGVFVFIFSTVTFFRSGAGKSGNFLLEIFYGNTFSDLRDFAWVLSAWDGNHFWGKTYLSAFMSFVPTTFSSFRAENNIGRITAILGGFDPIEHPGLRPGFFGESYLNFGIIGVIILGIILGYAMKMIDYTTKVAAYNNNKLEAFTVIVSTMFITNLPISAGFFSIYVFLITFLFLYLMRLFFKMNA